MISLRASSATYSSNRNLARAADVVPQYEPENLERPAGLDLQPHDECASDLDASPLTRCSGQSLEHREGETAVHSDVPRGPLSAVASLAPSTYRGASVRIPSDVEASAMRVSYVTTIVSPRV